MEIEPDSIAAQASALQRRYWAFHRPEFARLRDKLQKGTTWEERLRLLHLCCAGLLATPEGKDALQGDSAQEASFHPLCKVVSAVVSMLLEKSSPYRPRNSAIWQGSQPPTDDQQPDLVGFARNASLSHLGCLEYITLDENRRPERLAFLPLHRMRQLLLGKPALFRSAKIVHEDQTEEVVLLPLIYGFSWASSELADQDGTSARFVLPVKVAGYQQPLGIGLGHQEWLIAGEKGDTLVRLGAISLVDMPLDVRDSDWEEKARLRGLDLNEIRAQFGKPQKS